ncbi:MAG: hypothetical protein M3477_04650, partial [Gemmatimonadota bacterium]|nr:hypothetical protein [Gemmatimonadota bacterium]
WLLAAVPAGEPGGVPLGYAMLVVGPSGPTWDLGELTGELESLAVAEDARGCGVPVRMIARPSRSAARFFRWSCSCTADAG